MYQLLPNILNYQFSSVQFIHSVVSDSLDPMNCSMPGFPVHHQLPEIAQTHAHRVSDAIQTSGPLSSPSPPAFNFYGHDFQALHHIFLSKWRHSDWSGIKVLVRLQMSLCLGMDLLYKNLLNTHTTDEHCTGRTEACPGEDHSPGAYLWNKGWLWAVVTPEVRGIWNGVSHQIRRLVVLFRLTNIPVKSAV